jgi:predicted CXXCH cytochrome family protein
MKKFDLSRFVPFVVGALLAVSLGLTLWWTGAEIYWGGAARLAQRGPEQPIPFSHRLHVTDKDIDCRFCHTGVDRVHQAGIPPEQTCMFCHRVIITQHPEIRHLWEYYGAREDGTRDPSRGEPIPWVRVFEVPDHVYFTHRVHTQIAGLDCTDCHGPIESMDRVQQLRKFEMGFCLECHRPRGASTDCWTCHR